MITSYKNLKYTTEQDRMYLLRKLAEENGHQIGAVNRERTAYCPVESIQAPNTYIAERYGLNRVYLSRIKQDCHILEWIHLDGKRNDYRDDIIGELKHNEVFADLNEIVELKASNWREQLTGTKIGSLYDGFASLDPEKYEVARQPFCFAAEWLFETKCTVDEIMVWVRQGAHFYHANVLKEHGVTLEEASRVIDEQRGMTITSAFAVDEISIVEILKRLGKRIDVLDQVMSVSEAAKRWGMSAEDLSEEVEGPGGLFDVVTNLGYVRQSGNTWLIHEKAMYQVYGEPK